MVVNSNNYTGKFYFLIKLLHSIYGKFAEANEFCLMKLRLNDLIKSSAFIRIA